MRKADYFPPTVEKNISGCTFFRGEDDDELARKHRHAHEQKMNLLRQMEENKQRKEMEKRNDYLYDMQRLAVTDAVNKNHYEFKMRNLAVAQKAMDENI